MALINGIYIHVTDESIDRGVTRASHSVETGIAVTDTIKPEAKTISLTGEIVDYDATTISAPPENSSITAWLSMVKKDVGAVYEVMDFATLSLIVTLEGGASFTDTGQIQYFDADGTPVNCTEPQKEKVAQVKFELNMPYLSAARITGDSDSCFNIINKSTTGYEVQDYNADDETAASSTYFGESGRVRTEFVYSDNSSVSEPATDTHRTAAWCIEQIEAMEYAGALIKYEGRNLVENYQIKSFSTSHPNTIAGGASFTMTLEEFRGATNSFIAPNSSTNEGVNSTIPSEGVQQIIQGDNSEVWYEVRLGDCLYNLVSADNAEYRDLKREPIDGKELDAISWVMAKNPHAFENDSADSLKAYCSILMGTR